MLKTVSTRPKKRLLEEMVRGINAELLIAQGYMELFKILANTKFKVRGNRSCLPKTPLTKVMPFPPKERKEKKEKRNGR